MKITAILTSLLAASALAAQQPTPDNLAATLVQAKAAWGVESPDQVVIRAEALNSCNLRDDPHTAEIQLLLSTSVMKFDDGTELVADTSTRIWVIRINSNCNWARLDLVRTVIHEYGHALLGLEYHSTDRRSIMYYVVDGKGSQEILASDRAMLRALVSSK